jgi:hypothetical protein
MAQEQEKTLPQETLKRQELRFRGTSPLLSSEVISQSGWQETVYENPWNTTIYLAQSGPLPEKGTSRGRIRMRFRSSEQLGNSIYFPTYDQPCELEIKTHGSHERNSGQNMKYILKGATVGEVFAALQSRESFNDLDVHADEGTSFGELLAYYGGENTESLVPVGATSYRRNHFTNEQGVRVTTDTDVSYWYFGEQKKRWYALRGEVADYNIVEIKKPDAGLQVDTNAVCTQLFGAEHDFQPVAGEEESKFDHIRNEIKKGIKPVRANPEMRYGDDKEGWSFTEREVKIDLSSDGRAFLGTLAENPAEGVYLGPERQENVYQYFLVLDPETGIAVMSSTPTFEKPKYKGKIDISKQNGQLIREEVVGASLEEVQQKLQMKGRDTSEATESSRYVRAKNIRYAVCDSGNVYALIADHCEAEDGRTPLNQIEIEFLGQVTLDPQKTQADIEQLNAEFLKIQTMIVQKLAEQNIPVLPTQTTKFKWINT